MPNPGHDLHLAGRVIRLRSELSMNKLGRVLPLSGELLDVIERAAAHRRLDRVNLFHLNGRLILDFRDSWKTACDYHGLTALLVHDLRRSAVRNMVRASIPERVCMAISGHKTRATFDRYNIVSASDLTAATDKLYSHLSQQPATHVIPLKAAKKTG